MDFRTYRFKKKTKINFWLWFLIEVVLFSIANYTGWISGVLAVWGWMLLGVLWEIIQLLTFYLTSGMKGKDIFQSILWDVFTRIVAVITAIGFCFWILWPIIYIIFKIIGVEI